MLTAKKIIKYAYIKENNKICLHQRKVMEYAYSKENQQKKTRANSEI